jgi:lipopolysaccharide/colanic/teichoic acid biosynthesis glycosyltransferase
MTARVFGMSILDDGIGMPAGSRQTVVNSSAPGPALARTRHNGFGKRLFDVCVAIVSLIVLFPVMICAAVAVVATSPGPILYGQNRFGANGRQIRVLKFRTMRLAQCDSTSSRQTEPNDPRITSVGRFLRRYDIDELPQLLNVLAGNMSVVGPRPHPIRMKLGDRTIESLVPGYHERHRVRPGITGLAQISGCRGPVETEAQALNRQQYDLLYINNVSVTQDIRLLVRTLIYEIRRAYLGTERSDGRQLTPEIL